MEVLDNTDIDKNDIDILLIEQFFFFCNLFDAFQEVEALGIEDLGVIEFLQGAMFLLLDFLKLFFEEFVADRHAE